MTKVLIVEDDVFLRKMYTKKFQVNGFEIETASNGQEGLQKMSSFSPDIVLMDVMMPKLNGIEAIEKAKADENLKHIPILVLTNLSSAEDADTAVKKGAKAYLIKSEHTPTQIVEKVKKYLHK
jgi:CheY-like chemotaxis protein